jgi:GNAT superfamily N-acetyltransferase
MEMLAVDPPFQRRGIAKQLIAHGEALAREWNAKEMALDTSEHATELCMRSWVIESSTNFAAMS